MNRYPSPIQRFKKEMARVVFDARSSVYTDYGKKHIKQLFKCFDPEWHDIIANDYPIFLERYFQGDEDGYNQWQRLTSHLDDDEDKRWWCFEAQQVRRYLKQFHGLKTQS
jgi:hypothetical protein